MRNSLAVLGVGYLATACPSADPTPPAHAPSAVEEPAPPALVPIEMFLGMIEPDDTAFIGALAALEVGWRPSYAAMLLEIMNLVGDRDRVLRIVDLLERKTGERRGIDVNDWYEWLWQTNPGTHPEYMAFKAKLYSLIDPRFAEYFKGQTLIRLDEIRWGGVVRDGIPPLKDPEMIAARQATYLQDSNIVFGVHHQGDARAYPKRILAWHEMVKDTIGGEALCGVYCTLCGSMILYRTDVKNAGGKVHHELGTSGFLYRSNKLMYDHETKSLWSTLTGTPAVGPLVGQGIKLEPLSVVTTTWKEWRQRHPDTKVLSLNTGHERDYGEGVAYHDYFSTDDLMFNVPKVDKRLANKAEVFALRIEGADPLAISLRFLEQHPVYQDRLGKIDFVILTDRTGANRAYDSGGRKFVSWDGATVKDDRGESWTVTEDEISTSSQRLPRLPGHRAFWFGWYSAFPQTRLVD